MAKRRKKKAKVYAVEENISYTLPTPICIEDYPHVKIQKAIGKGVCCAVFAVFFVTISLVTVPFMFLRTVLVMLTKLLTYLGKFFNLGVKFLQWLGENPLGNLCLWVEKHLIG